MNTAKAVAMRILGYANNGMDILLAEFFDTEVFRTLEQEIQ